jgi:hypothetical protein
MTGLLLTAGAAVPVTPEAFDVALAASAVSVAAMSVQSPVVAAAKRKRKKSKGRNQKIVRGQR